MNKFAFGEEGRGEGRVGEREVDGMERREMGGWKKGKGRRWCRSGKGRTG